MVESLPTIPDYSAKLYKKLGRDKIEKIKQLKNDPRAWYSTPTKAKEIINLMYKFAPGAFKASKAEFTPGLGLGFGSKEAAKAVKSMTPQVRQEQLVEQGKNKGVQAQLLGLIDSDQFQKLVDTGIAPKLKGDQTVMQRLMSIGGFPLQKVLSAVNAIPRGEAGMMRANLEAVKELAQEKKGGASNLDLIKSMFQKSPEVASETFKSFFNTPGAKSNDYFAQIYKDYLPERFSQGFEWTKDQDDWIKGTNWLQKLGSAVAGSPADIAGLATDVILDPLTYLTGGLIKGAKVADIGVDIVSKTGAKVIPKGATVVLKKAGQEAVEEATPRLLKVVRKLFSKEIKSFASKTQLDDFLNKKITEQFIKEISGKKTAGQILNLFDTGGAKIAGQTVIPGFKLQQTFGKSLDKIAKMPVFRNVVKFFNPQAGVDEVFRPLKAYGESMARHIYGDNLAKFIQAVKGLSKQELDDLNMLKIIDSNIPLLTRKLTRAQNALKANTRATGKLFADEQTVKKLQSTVDGIVSKLDELQKMRDGLNITPKVQKASDDIGKLLGDVFEQEKVLDVKRAEDYFPAIFQRETDPRKWAETSVEKAFFEKPKTRDVLEAMKEGLKPAPITDAIPFRLRAGAKRLARVELTDGVKQFGIKGKKLAPKGWIQLKDHKGKVLKELDGWYFPKELENSFNKVGQLFFGDEAARNAFKYYDKMLTIWKRWALATPGYHFRNFYSDTFSGVMEYGLDFLNPVHWRDFAKLKKNGFLTIKGKTYTVDDFLKAGIEPGQYIAEGQLRQGMPEKLIGKISPAEWSLKFGQHREGLGRGVAGIIELKKGSNIMDAAFNVKKVFFDYMSLTPAEQNLMKRIFPFYTWMRKNLQRQVELLGTRTGGYASIPKFLNYLEETAGTMYGQDFIEQFKDTQPDYFRDLGATITAIKGKDGMPLVWNPNLPFQDWSRLTGKDLMSATSPLIKIVTEMVTNKDIFFGSTIDRSREGQFNYSKAPSWLAFIVKKLPEKVKNQAGMQTIDDEVYISDKFAYAIRQIPPLASLSRVLPATETPSTPLQMMSVGLGAKFFPFDAEKEKAYRAKEFSDAVNSLTPPNEMGVSDLTSAFKSLYDKTISEQTGIDDIRDLEAYLDVTGSSKELDLVVRLLKEPYNKEKDKIKGLKLYEIVELLKSIGVETDLEGLKKMLEAK